LPTSADAQKGAIATLRRHAWSLFQAVIAQPSTCEAPVWRRWPDKAETLAADRARPPQAVLRLAIPPEMTLAPNAAALKDATATPSTFEAVNFNPIAYRHVRERRLYDPAVAQRLVAAGVRDIPEFPAGSVVVKTFWRVVPAQGITPLGLWDWSNVHCDPHDCPAAPESGWARHVCVYQSSPPQPDPACPLVDAGQFYSILVADPSEYRCMGCELKLSPGDRLILIGMHIATKETPDWLWGTFWWRGLDRTDGDAWNNDNAQRPATLSGFWKNYSMDTTLSLFNRSRAGGPNAAMFNPYIEGATAGTGVNCVSCHDQATAGGSAFIGLDISAASLEGKLRTDFLWSLASHLRGK